MVKKINGTAANTLANLWQVNGRQFAAQAVLSWRSDSGEEGGGRQQSNVEAWRADKILLYLWEQRRYLALYKLKSLPPTSWHNDGTS